MADESVDVMAVRRDQCNGRTMACVCCGSPLGTQHVILCYAGQKQFNEETRR